jgi:hypothetical protein
VTTAFVIVAVVNDADCSIDSDLFIVCANANGGYGRGGTTYGNVFITGDPKSSLTEGLLAHEKAHRYQWAALGPIGFPLTYYLNEGAGVVLPGPAVCWNFFEWQAGFDRGRYSSLGKSRRDSLRRLLWHLFLPMVN